MKNEYHTDIDVVHDIYNKEYDLNNFKKINEMVEWKTIERTSEEGRKYSEIITQNCIGYFVIHSGYWIDLSLVQNGRMRNLGVHETVDDAKIMAYKYIYESWKELSQYFT